MSLKSSVVLVNQFTNKNVSRSNKYGSTPGDYVLRYMARDGATEDLTPVRLNTEDYITRYMARSEAVDNGISVSDIKDKMRDIQGYGGIAFGYGEYSLSHKKLLSASKDIQSNYDNGKTVMKTVISFDKAYLLQNGIIRNDLFPDRADADEGSYRGNIDQLKLRMAIMHGIDRLSKHYDDLQYVGVIQVDTKHVHCHLAMVDRGRGTIMPDGTQRGKITEAEKRDLRRGIDMYLDQSRSVKMMTSNLDCDKRNTLCFIKKYTHEVMDNRGFSQFLLACLPEDRNLWRASTNRKEMRKPNSIVRSYVDKLLALPGSGYQNALDQVDAYAVACVNNEGLSTQEYRNIRKIGKQRIIDESINGVYSVLKKIPRSEFNMSTPMLDSMSESYEDMADDADESNPLIEFGFKLRSYKNRLDYHKKEYHKYDDAVKSYERSQNDGKVASASWPLYNYFKIEAEYNEMLLSKYNSLLKFMPSDDEYSNDFMSLISIDKRMHNISNMMNDSSLKRMLPANAEQAGIMTYGETGGRTLVSNPAHLGNRQRHLRSQYDMQKAAFLIKLQDYGMTLSDDNKIVDSPLYDFDDVKSLDLHHLLYDFPGDIQISNINSNKFVAEADKRYDAFSAAKQYLIQSGQSDQLDNFPETDIELQHSTASHFRNDDTLHTKRSMPDVIKTKNKPRKPVSTVRIDYDFYVHQEDEIKNVIKNTINSLQYDNM